MFSTLCSAVDGHDEPNQGAKQLARLAMRVAEVYRLQEQDLPSDTDLTKLLALFVNRSASLQQAARLMLLFPQLSGQIDLEAAFEKFATAHLHTVGQQIAARSGRPAQLVWVQQCLAAQELKAAVEACRQFELQASFPDLENRWLQRSMEKCMARGKWGAAGVLASNNKGMQVCKAPDLRSQPVCSCSGLA